MTLRGLTVLATVVFSCLADQALAQASASQRQTTQKREKEFVIGGVFAGPTSVGSAPAELLGGSDVPTVTLFRVENSLAPGFGIEANIGVRWRGPWWIEVSGGWTRSQVRTKITDDFEDAPNETISSPMSRFLLEGAMLRYFRSRASSSLFARFNGGWMRETAGGNTLVGDGLIAGGGIGYRHWWRTAGKGSVKRLGLRLEGRAEIRSGGISLGEAGIRFGPSATALLVFGY